MHESIFETPEQIQDDSRLSWLFIDPAEDTMMESNLSSVYGTERPTLGDDEWPMH